MSRRSAKGSDSTRSSGGSSRAAGPASPARTPNSSKRPPACAATTRPRRYSTIGSISAGSRRAIHRSPRPASVAEDSLHARRGWLRHRRQPLAGATPRGSRISTEPGRSGNPRRAGRRGRIPGRVGRRLPQASTASSKRLSVADKIVSHEGVSVRTTGDLLLTGEVYEQYGEIQEKRVVQCRSITAYADVFGNILSSGGVVRLKSNLVGGSASNDDGDIFVDGRASGATLIAQHGCITVKRADNCVILLAEVVIEQATNCSIVAEEVRVEDLRSMRHGRPDPPGRQRPLASRTRLRAAPPRSRPVALSGGDCHPGKQAQRLDSTIAGSVPGSTPCAASRRSRAICSWPASCANQELTLNPEQQVAWRRLSAQVAPVLRPGAPGRSGPGTGRPVAGILRREIEAAHRRPGAGVQTGSIGEVDAIDGETRDQHPARATRRDAAERAAGQGAQSPLARTDAATSCFLRAVLVELPADPLDSLACSPPPD
jgi:hypothetical protein